MNGNKSATAQFIADPTIQNSPVGKWEITITGANKGAAFVIFDDDFTWNGVGLRGGAYGLCELTGTWSYASSGKKVIITGAGSEMVNSNHTWNASFSGKSTAGKKVTALVNTETGPVFKWSGKPSGSSADLSGHWVGQVSTSNVVSAADYILVRSDEESGLFEIREQTVVDSFEIVVGDAVVTSKNKLVVHVKLGGRNCILTGRYAPTKRRISLKGFDEYGQPVSITIK